MTRFFTFLATAFVAFAATASLVLACEGGCRSEPVQFLANRYSALLDSQLNNLPRNEQGQARRINQQVMGRLVGRNNVIDKVIFARFRGTCVNPGHRSPDELCGSAKSIACYAPWGHAESLFEDVHEAVGETLRNAYSGSSPDVRRTMVDQVVGYCPSNCWDWVEPFQNIMLTWERREHPDNYRVTPNCLPLGRGGI